MKSGATLVSELVTKRQESFDFMFNILYDGRKIYKDLTHEECAEVLSELSSSYYETGEYDPNLIELEEIVNG